MRDAIATLDAIGINADMTHATQRKLDQQAHQDWKSRLGPNGSEISWQDAIRLVVKHTQGDSND